MDVAAEDGAAAVFEGVGDHGRGAAPAQPVPFQVEGPDHRGGCRERVERAEQVVHVVRVEAAVAADRPAGFGGRLQDDDPPARVGQYVGRDQAVGA